MGYKRYRPEEIVGSNCKGYGPDCVGCVMEHTCEDEERRLHNQLEVEMAREEEAVRRLTQSGEKPQLAKIETIYKTNYRQVAATLRHIADQIDHEDFSRVESAALVIRCRPDREFNNIGPVEIFGMGVGDFDATVTILSQGLNQLLNQTPYNEDSEEEDG